MKLAHVEVGQVWQSKRGKEYVSAFRVDRVGSLYVTGTNVGPPHRQREILRSSFTENGSPYRLVGTGLAAPTTKGKE